MTQPKLWCSRWCQCVYCDTAQPWCSCWCQFVVTQPKSWCCCWCQCVVTQSKLNRWSPSLVSQGEREEEYKLYHVNETPSNAEKRPDRILTQPTLPALQEHQSKNVRRTALCLFLPLSIIFSFFPHEAQGSSVMALQLLAPSSGACSQKAIFTKGNEA